MINIMGQFTVYKFTLQIILTNSSLILPSTTIGIKSVLKRIIAFGEYYFKNQNYVRFESKLRQPYMYNVP